MIRALLLLALLPLTRIGLADHHQPPSLTLGSAYPGGVAIVRIPVAEDDQPRARFGQRNLMILYRDGRWYAVVGVSSSILPGNYVVNTFSEREDDSSAEFAVLARTPRLDATGTARVLKPDSEDTTFQPLNRSMRPLDTEGLPTFSSATPDLDLSPVVEPLEASHYGSWLDDGEMSQQDYIQYTTRKGAQVYAPTDGIVRAIVDQGDFGLTLYLDHGAGMLSVFGRLTDPLVEIDQVVQRGEQIASTSTTSDNTAGILDWAIQLNGWLVDPAAVSRLGESLSR